MKYNLTPLSTVLSTGLLSTPLTPRMKKAFIASSPVLNDEMEAESFKTVSKEKREAEAAS
jgi:hypothetical protein